MPFKFLWLCQLLEELESNRHKRARSINRALNHEHQIIQRWYGQYDHRIERTGPAAIAFLSCLFPERRSDRVYRLQRKRLTQIFGRALGLGSSRVAELNQWSTQYGSDLPECIERVMRQCENATPVRGREVTLEEINDVLDLVAARCPSSSATIKARTSQGSVVDLLIPITRRLHSTEAKWLARMILKRYCPVQVPEYEGLHGLHFMLPNILAIQNSLQAAVLILAKDAIRYLPPRPDKSYETVLHALVAEHVQPQLGTMVRRQPYHKARSIKHCCGLADAKQMSVERKYDGEYCQVHIDMLKNNSIQIFSKSGRDSTDDRMRLHSAIEHALRIGRNGCRIRRNCIVEGELLIWSSASKSMLPFYKIRKFIKHGGFNIGTANDSPTHRDEHLMIAFYDILLLDDQPLFNKAHQTRRQYLKSVLHTKEGSAILGERTIIDFQSSQASKKLREVFAKAIVQRWEGLVLKGSQDPYFTWGRQYHGIKLKKDYITGLGDSADLCIVGGRRDAHVEAEIGVGPLRWTCFYIGAVCNLDDVRRFDLKPRIKIIDILTSHSMPSADIADLNRLGLLTSVPFAPSIDEFELEMGHSGIKKPTELFTKPFVVEIMGAGYEKGSNSPYYTLRFPRKTDGKIKLHMDRTVLDTVGFSELQTMAEYSLSVPHDAESQEDALWIERLTTADGRMQRCQSISQAMSSARTPSSAPAISLSPVSSKSSSDRLVFIRTDTEEPETQRTDRTTQDSIYRRPHEYEGQRPLELSPTSKMKRLRPVLCDLAPGTSGSNCSDQTIKRRRLHGTDAGQLATPDAIIMRHHNLSPLGPTQHSKTTSRHAQDSLPTSDSEGEQFSKPSDSDYFSIPLSKPHASTIQRSMSHAEPALPAASNSDGQILVASTTFPPVLLTSSFATRISLAILPKLEASYTFSMKAFLQQVTVNLANGHEIVHHIVIVECGKIDSVVHTMSLLATEIEQCVMSVHKKSPQTTTITNRNDGNVTDDSPHYQRMLDKLSNRMLVFDHHTLDELSVKTPANSHAHDKVPLSIQTLSKLDLCNGKGKNAALFIGSVHFEWRSTQNVPVGQRVSIKLKYNFDWVTT